MPSSRSFPRFLTSLAMIGLLLATGSGAAARPATPIATPGASPDSRGVAPLPLTGERRAAFEAYVAAALLRYNVPGASVAVVQNGDVVYLNGFGVTVAGGTQPVTPDTMMMIGSITKSMTTMLAATLVDDGTIAWDSHLVDLLPGFAVADPSLATSLTVRDAFCNCSGIPGQNLESYFAGLPPSPETVVQSLANVAPTAPPGERYQYANALIAAGGYALGAANGSRGDLGVAYDTALRERVLGPIGMTHSTFDQAAVLASGNYALPHSFDLSGSLRRIPLVEERNLLPIRPAGGLWSNAREMARYLQTELSGGVAPNGTRVVSTENLSATWTPTVPIPTFPGVSSSMAASQTGYGMGWMLGEYHGLRLINHAGGTNGFSAELGFLPAANLGIVILSNSLAAGIVVGAAFPYAVQFRLLEILFGQPPQIDAELAPLTAALAASQPQLAPGVDSADVAPYLGRYTEPELGEVTVSLRDGRLVFDTGAVRSELRPRAADGGADLSVSRPAVVALFAGCRSHGDVRRRGCRASVDPDHPGQSDRAGTGVRLRADCRR
ncbi:MAG: serine hydrolase [Thermomicrobiales bacterium]